MSNQLQTATTHLIARSNTFMTQLATFQLYFGRTCPNGDSVTDEEWEIFLKYSVDPVFQDYTLQTATGVWKGSTEQVMILSISTDDELGRAKIFLIAEKYKQLFQQDSVGLLVLPPITFL